MNKSRIIHQLLTLMLILCITGCTAYKRKLALDECEKYGGAWGEYPIKTKGVFDRLRVLNKNDILYRSIRYINNGLEFVEYSSDVVWLPGQYFKWGDPQYKDFNDDFKYYRVFVTSRGDALCRPYEILYEKAKENPLFDIADDQCLAVEGFDDPDLLRAQYEYRSIDNPRENKFVRWRDIQVVERKTGQIVTGFNWFAHCIGGVQRSVFYGALGCYGGDDAFIECPAEGAELGKVINNFEDNLFINNDE